ncbi:DUF1433 domain-containing protein [Bacillus sp. FSL W8-0645]|uniref:DUF1433 domain-containing protein n=1 Tax=Bacillus TaxID=1386 RepID=UPI0007EEEE50|nr:DUF1433 domain-containing protein [Bacillus pumilus]MBU8575377.1 DUF1433 domain-containing protein [Bacillus pumilus]OBS83818.1 DUF1433 domain-containing protein [Bacillus pumilus]PRS28162.1 DUF1433 domain-containing protein [Bacillus pumilus]
MKNKIKITIIFIALITIISVTLFLLNGKQSQTNESGGKVIVQEKEKSEQQKAEEFAEKMKPKIEKRLHKMDIHNFIETISFKKGVTINPMGYIRVRGYVNGEPERFEFSASLEYRSNEVGSMSISSDLSDRFENWADFDPQVKEDFLNSLSKKEREQYLKDIGEKE